MLRTDRDAGPLPRHRAVIAVAVIAVVSSLASCAGGGASSPAPPDRFINLIGSGVDVDYTALRSPQDALQRADAALVGRIESVFEGRVTTTTEGGVDRIVTSGPILKVRVEQAFVGAPTAGEAVRVQLHTAPHVTVNELAESLPTGRVLLILDDITELVAVDGAAVEGPAGPAPEERLYFPYTDGFWFDLGRDGIASPEVSGEELEARWGTIESFDALLDLLIDAAG